MSKFVNERFVLDETIQSKLKKMKPIFGYGQFGEAVYYRTYSRQTSEGTQERWHDTVIRVINGVMSIRKDHYIKNHIEWNAKYWDNYAASMALSMFKMAWLPPGRGLWACGTDIMYNRGAMALTNCAFTDIQSHCWIEDMAWIMDCLMFGTGVGFEPLRDDDFMLYEPTGTYDWIIPDSREGWVESVSRLLEAFARPDQSIPIFDYGQIRPKGALIRGFGGTASGPEPLEDLHKEIVNRCYRFIQDGRYDSVMFKTDIANLIGCCVVTGNIRRSAEIAVLDINDPVFMDLKDAKKHPYRAGWAFMSNNSVKLSHRKDFERLDEIASRVVNNGEPGVINMKNLPFGRLGHKQKDKLKRDAAFGMNPCSEINLERKETCILSETLPTRCSDVNEWLMACEYACFYASTIALLPTHQPETNRVIARNRRIGVGIIDFIGWTHETGVNMVIKNLRRGYKKIREVNKRLADEAGVPESIRVTTMKPGGSVPKVAGRRSGASWSNFRYMVRRMRVTEGTKFAGVLIKAGVPYEYDSYTKNTLCFEFPVVTGNDDVPISEEISLWQQAMNIMLLQYEWADNAVSNTLNFAPKWKLISVETMTDDTLKRKYDPRFVKVIHEFGKTKTYHFNPKHEENEVESVLSMIVPHVKSVSMLPHSDAGVYPQMPEEGITRQEYEGRVAQIGEINWDEFDSFDSVESEDDKYCSGASCTIQLEVK